MLSLKHLWRRFNRWLDKVGAASTTYTPQIEVYPAMSRERRMVHHFKTGEMAEADVVQSRNFTLTFFVGDHGSVMKIDRLRDLLLTGMINLHTKVQTGLIPLALRVGNEEQVDTIITDVEQMTEQFFTDITTLLYEHGVSNATTPFYVSRTPTTPLKKAS